MRISELRPKINTLLKNKGFVEETDDTIIITEANNDNKKGRLKQVTINNSCKTKMWRINLEQKVNGLTTSEKTCEAALIIETKKTLWIYLIELKSNSLDFSDITQKIEASINRFYFLLLLNSDNNHLIDYNIKFKGFVFHNPHPTLKNNTIINNQQLYNVYMSSTPLSIKIQTTLDNDEVVPVKFFNQSQIDLNQLP